jgi:hypothetical protein
VRDGYGYYLVTLEALKNVPRLKAFNKLIVARGSTPRPQGRRP